MNRSYGKVLYMYNCYNLCTDMLPLYLWLDTNLDLLSSELLPGLLEHLRLHHSGRQHSGRSHGGVRGITFSIIT
jgi:hypothetical protein